MAARDQPPQNCPGSYTDLGQEPPKQDAIHGPRPSQASEQTTCPTTCRMARKWEPRWAPAGLQGSAIGAHPATCQWSPPRWSPSMSRSVNADRGGFCPRLCAALLGFRRRACLRMPCDAIWCEFWVCDEMGSLSSSRLDAPTGCEVRFCLANAKLSLLGSFGFLAHTRSLRTTLWVAFTQALCSLAYVPSPGLPTLALRRNLVRILGLRRDGEPIKFSPWCSHGMWSSILLSQCQALASWLFWLLGTYSIFAVYALSGVYPGSVQPCLCSVAGFAYACLATQFGANFGSATRYGEPIKFSPWCSHRMWSSILLSQCQALASWLFWLLGTYSIFAGYALSGDSHPANVKLGEFFSPVRDLYRFCCAGGALCFRSFVQAGALQLIPHSLCV